MVHSVIPPNRQSNSLENEIKALFEGVNEDRFELKPGVELNEDFNLDDILEQGFDSVFIGMGLPESIKISGEKADNLYDALDFLSKAKSSKLDLRGKRAAVIGGGNTAMDVASTAADCGAEDVYVIYRRSFAQMPAWKEERDRAVEKGVHFMILHQPVDYICEDGKINALKLTVNQLGKPDASGRRSPEPVKGSELEFPIDIVIEAIGQKSVQGLEKVLSGVKIKDGLIQTNQAFETSRKNVYAAGDIVKGADTVVAAVADGMKAGREIDAKLKEL
jgi:glutamate synthase (NADPH/NADH) small chain